jgi:hypothetical protein
MCIMKKCPASAFAGRPPQNAMLQSVLHVAVAHDRNAHQQLPTRPLNSHNLHFAAVVIMTAQPSVERATVTHACRVYMDVRMYVCMCVMYYLHIYIRSVNMYVHMYVCMYVCIHVMYCLTYTYIQYIYIYIWMCICTYVCTYVCT